MEKHNFGESGTYSNLLVCNYDYWFHISLQVAQQCKENIFAIQTLRDFQYIEEGKDQGNNVREKAKHLVLLLKDDERLRNERARALKAKERFAQTPSGFGSDTGIVSIHWKYFMEKRFL